MENLLIKRAQLTPTKIGLRYQEQTWSYESMLQQAQMVLNQLVMKLNKKPKRVAVLGSNSPELYFTLLGLNLGAIEIVMINNRLTSQEITLQLEIAQVDSLIYETSFKSIAETCTGHSWISMSDLLVQHPDLPMSEAIRNISEEMVNTIMFTSGTTGTPKGVKQTFGNHWASAIGSSLNLGVSDTDKWLLAVPLYHISGYSMLMKGLIYGNEINLVSKFDAISTIHLIQQREITHISLVPTMLNSLLIEEDFLNDCKSLKCILLGGAPVSQKVLELCHQYHLPIIQSFGMTETASQVVALNHQESLRKIGSSGKPLFPVSLKIAETDQANVVGEILIKGNNVSPGYLNATFDCTEAGYFKTGDLGYLDDEGFLYVVGRQKELIISGGENIYPLEIENKLLQHSSIKDVAVTGEADDYWGEKVVAYIECEKPLDQHELANVLCELSRYKQPKSYYLVNNIPRNSLGKLQKNQLSEQLVLEKLNLTLENDE